MIFKFSSLFYMKNISKVTAVFIGLVLAGCATVGSIERNYALVDYSDGIDKKEAVAIAKQHMVNSQYSQRFQTIGPRIEDMPAQNAWLVRFHGKKTSIGEFYMPSFYEVTIDKQTGSCRLVHMNNVTSIR